MSVGLDMNHLAFLRTVNYQENPMVVVSSHTTPWDCENLESITARRNICMNCHWAFECS